MKNIFIISGYGIPKDILKDEPYRKYLGFTFNKIYQICLDKKDKEPIIIFTGGPSDVFKPYKRTEAQEMKKLFLNYAKRDFVRKHTKTWKYKTENKSLCTIENIIYSDSLVKNIRGKKFFYLFCEYTRRNKVKTFAKKIIKKNFKVIDLDFDLSANRYLEPEFLHKKESFSVKYELKTLTDQKFKKQFHKTLEDRLDFFRKQGPKKHRKAIEEWWKTTLKQLQNYK
jgi:hypothetical protein